MSLRGTDNIQGKLYEHILAPTGGYAQGKLFTNSLPFITWDVYFPVFSGKAL